MMFFNFANAVDNKINEILYKQTLLQDLFHKKTSKDYKIKEQFLPAFVYFCTFFVMLLISLTNL